MWHLQIISSSHKTNLVSSGCKFVSMSACFYCSQITVEHPAAKSMIEIARTQDEEVGDGTTSVIILGNETSSCLNLNCICAMQ